MTFPWRFSLMLIFCYSISEITGNTIYSKVDESKVIQWTITPKPGNVLVRVLDPSGDTLYSAIGTDVVKGTTSNAGRVTNTGNTNTITGHVEFTLNDVKVTDAGDYKANVAVEGLEIIRSGVTLVVYVKPSTPVITVVTAPIVGQNMLLQCTASSNSKPDGQLTMKYKWYINKADLPTDSRYVTTGSQLQVKNIQKSDKDSNFTCKGYETESLFSEASDGYKPSVLYGPDAVTLSPNTVRYDKEENDDIGPITCSADCNSPCTYQWKLNGGNVGGQSNTLSLNNIKRGQSGSYVCTAANRFGTKDSQTVAVTVKYGPEKVTFTPATLSYTLVEVTKNTLSPITCSAVCNPPCSYQWSLDGTVLRSEAVLELTGATRANDGAYTCNATNSYGGKTSAAISITVEYKPGVATLSPDIGQYTKKENDNIGPITCSAASNPPCTYQWKFNGSNVGGQSNTLTLNNIQRGSAGSYKCVATNEHGSSDSRTITISVEYGPGTVTLSPSTQSYTLVEGIQNSLGPITCTADCNPQCTHQWSRDGTVIRSAAFLELNGATRADDGTYKCNARNVYGNKDSATVRVNVEYKPGAVTFSPVAEQYTKGENDDIGTITCSADSNPPCTYQWKFNGSNIVGQSNKLTLSNIQRGSAGSYKCVATNKHGSSESKTITVTVKYGPKTVTLMPSSTSYKLVEVTQTTLGPITCSADCNSPCTYQWSRNGTVFSSAAVLKLTGATRADDGTYICNASNSYGNKASVKVRITVEYKPEQSKIEPQKYAYELLESDKMGPITCSAICNPPCGYKWRHDSGDFIQTAVIDFAQVTRTQAGTYTCVATNIHGKIESKDVSVVVEYPPDNVMIRKVKPEVNVRENNTFSVICTTNSVPSSDIKIWFNGEGNRVIHEMKTSLEVNYTRSAECLDTGEYFCVAKNKRGNATSPKIDVNVLCSPRPRNTNFDNIVTVGDNEDLDITGSVIANPRPDISWTFQQIGYNDSISIQNDTDDVEIYMSSYHVTYNSRIVKENTGISDLGNYVMNASNVYGFYILNYDVSSKRSPKPPYSLNVTCDVTEAKIEWISNFNGGVTQEFIIGINKSRQSHGTYTVADEGMNKRHQQTVSNLDANTKYSFAVNAKNSIGSSVIPPSIYCTTRPSNEKPGIPAALIGGIAGGSFFLLILVIILAVVFLLKRRKSEKDDSNELVNRRGMPSQDHTDDGIRQNILYEPAGPFLQQQNTSAADCQYAAVDKSTKKQNNSADVYATVDKSAKQQNNSSDVYAEVEKKGKKQKPDVKKAKPKGTQKKATEKPSGEVYVNFGGNFVDESANTSKAGPKDKAGKEKPQTKAKPSAGKAGKGKSSSKRKNKEGLIYVDVEFGDPGKNKLNGIHGIEKRVDYVDIDFTRRADPLPSDDEEDDDGGKKNEETKPGENEDE